MEDFSIFKKIMLQGRESGGRFFTRELAVFIFK